MGRGSSTIYLATPVHGYDGYAITILQRREVISVAKLGKVKDLLSKRDREKLQAKVKRPARRIKIRR